MENKQMDDQLEARLKEMMMEKVPQSEIVDKKLEEAYQGIREGKAKEKRKVPAAVKFGTAAAVLMAAMLYFVKNSALAAQLPLIGNIFRELEGKVSYPGDYSNNSIKLPAALNDTDSDAETDQTEVTVTGKKPDQAEEIKSDGKPDRTDGSSGKSYQAQADGVTVTISEAAFDNDALYLALSVQNEKGFVKEPLYPDQLCYDAQVKMFKADGSTEKFNYKSEGNFVKAIEGEFIDSHTFQGIYEFSEPYFDYAEYTACDVKFQAFHQNLTTGRDETVIVPDYGEVTQTVYDMVHYKGPWSFHFDFDDITFQKQTAAVHEKNGQGFGIKKVVKTAFGMYAVPILPKGENEYDYVVTIWDADGKPLEPRHVSKYLSMSHYGRDVSKVTVYLLKMQDFLDNKGNNSAGQPEKAIFKTTISFEGE